MSHIGPTGGHVNRDVRLGTKVQGTGRSHVGNCNAVPKASGEPHRTHHILQQQREQAYHGASAPRFAPSDGPWEGPGGAPPSRDGGCAPGGLALGLAAALALACAIATTASLTSFDHGLRNWPL